MERFDRLLAQVLDEARALSIPVSAHIEPHVEVNGRARTRFGCCLARNGRYTIQLSARLLEGPDWACRQTLAHEVLHTCPGCANHGPRWKEYARRMNEAYGYAITRTAPSEALGLPLAESQAKHLLVCTRCGAAYPRMRASALVRHPQRYRCRCGGTLRLEY